MECKTDFAAEEDLFSRTRMLLGVEGVERLRRSAVLVFGVGGVGGYAVEALARSGVGRIGVVDSDDFSVSNLNRQIFALHSTLGKKKVNVAEERILDINPECTVEKFDVFFLPENSADFDFSRYDYIVDCIDTVSAKIQIALQAQESGVRAISSMGAGNKLDPTKFRVSDIYQTSVCPLARVMRRELKKRGVEKLKCVYSTENSIKTGTDFPGSCAFVPSVAGLILASEVVRDLTESLDS